MLNSVFYQNFQLKIGFVPYLTIFRSSFILYDLEII